MGTFFTRQHNVLSMHMRALGTKALGCRLHVPGISCVHALIVLGDLLALPHVNMCYTTSCGCISARAGSQFACAACTARTAMHTYMFQAPILMHCIYCMYCTYRHAHIHVSCAHPHALHMLHVLHVLHVRCVLQVIPNEYGILPEDKLSVGSKVSRFPEPVFTSGSTTDGHMYRV